MESQIFSWVSQPYNAPQGTEGQHGYVILTDVAHRYYDWNGSPLLENRLRLTVRGTNGQQTIVSIDPANVQEMINAMSDFLSAAEQRDEECQQERKQKAAGDGPQSKELP